MMDNSIERFLDGQRFGYDTALAEVKAGQKRNHWIWYCKLPPFCKPPTNDVLFY